MAEGRKTISKAMRQQVYDSLNGHCGYCGCKITIKEMQVDHIEAVYLHEKELKAGKVPEINSIENYMPACRACNFYKSTMSIEKFRKQLETLPERLEKVFIYRLAKKYGIVKENCEKVKFYFENIKTGGENEANE
jgi:5-methylcytosine-specific restriction endonuclease McrA